MEGIVKRQAVPVTVGCAHVVEHVLLVPVGRDEHHLKQADVNVIIVDWSEGNVGLYESACANARIVGAELALFIRKLKVGARFNSAKRESEREKEIEAY